ncbi:hypothetical protein ID854_14000 [Xenorhabdus sp. M]|uniref:Uncharacterized protein n=1 Tax=Xenorhabdus szentirmaii TaxID=290112 RepID=A0AAW3YVM1_9GAMM|nr:hypothetical protein [Xenorhabdus sp. M]
MAAPALTEPSPRRHQRNVPTETSSSPLSPDSQTTPGATLGAGSAAKEEAISGTVDDSTV